VTNGSRSGEGIHTRSACQTTRSFRQRTPRTGALVGPVRLARNLVTTPMARIMKIGGYSTPNALADDGFAAASNEQWQAPGHWREVDGEWAGDDAPAAEPVDAAAPVCHICYYEADAFARCERQAFADRMEWEVAARAAISNDACGIVWQWTRSA